MGVIYYQTAATPTHQEPVGGGTTIIGGTGVVGGSGRRRTLPTKETAGSYIDPKTGLGYSMTPTEATKRGYISTPDSGGGTYDTQTGTYTDSSGLKYSLAQKYVPAGTEIITTPTITPTKAFPDIVKAYKDPTLKEAVSTIKTTVQYEGVGAGIRQAPSLIWKAIYKPTEAERMRKEREEKKIEEAEVKMVLGARGLSGERRYEKKSDSQLLSDAKLGDQYSLIAYTRRQEEQIEINAEQQSQKINNEILKRYDQESDTIQDKINRGEISHNEGINIQRGFGERLQAEGQERLDNFIEKDIAPRQERIDDAAKKGKIATAVVTVAATFLTGVGAGVVLTGTTTAGKVVMAGAGVMAGKEAVELGTGVVKGERDIIDVATFGATLTAFVVGAKVGGKIKTSTQQTKLEGAIKRSDIKYKTEGISGEAEITRLNIPEGSKTELVARLKGGGSLRKIKADLKPTTAADKKIIQENLPYRKTEFIEVVDRMGNVINRVAIGKVTVAGKTGKQFTQDVITESKGRITPEGIVEFETLTAVAPEAKPKAVEGEPIKKVVYTREQITGTVRRAGDLRLVRTETGVKLIEAIEAEKGRPLTQRDIERLLLSAKTGKPISKGEYIELARTRRLDIKALQADKDIFIIKEETLKTKGIGISKQILEVPPTVKRKPKTPFEKTFPKDSKIKKIREKVSEDINKIVKSTDKRVKQVQEQMPKVEEQLVEQPIGIETGTRISFEQAAKQIAARQKLPTAILTGEKMLDLNKLLGREKADLILQQPEILQRGIFDMAQLQEMGMKQLQELRQRQIPAQQIAPPTITQPSPTIPDVPIPTVVVPPTLPEERLIPPKELEKKIKKRLKQEDDYAASLSSAILGTKPAEITPEQLKKLTKREFLGHEIRPLLKLKPSKKRKKKIKI